MIKLNETDWFGSVICKRLGSSVYLFQKLKILVWVDFSFKNFIKIILDFLISSEKESLVLRQSTSFFSLLQFVLAALHHSRLVLCHLIFTFHSFICLFPTTIVVCLFCIVLFEVCSVVVRSSWLTISSLVFLTVNKHQRPSPHSS